MPDEPRQGKYIVFSLKDPEQGDVLRAEWNGDRWVTGDNVIVTETEGEPMPETKPEQITILVWVETDKVGSRSENEFTVDRGEWEDMTEEERESLARDAMWERVEWGFGVEEEEANA